MIYFDHNATTPIIPAAKDMLLGVLTSPANPSSIHAFGRKSKMLVEDARKSVAEMVGASSQYQIIFTASGTESNNIALKGFPELEILTTTVEHPSILKVAKEGLIPVDGNGIVDIVSLKKLLAHFGANVLVSVQLANHETGVIQPIKQIAELVHEHGGIIHSDATQAFGKINVDIEDLDLDLVTLSGHKFGAPVGAAALIFKKNLPLLPLMQGGGQEFRFRPGTQNVAAICALGMVAANYQDMLKSFMHVEMLRDYLEKEISKVCASTIIFGKAAERLPNTSTFTMPDVGNETQVIHFDTNNIAVSAGAACSSGRADLPYIQMAMGVSEEIARTAIRVSLGINNTKEEVDKFIVLWKELYLKNERKNG